MKLSVGGPRLDFSIREATEAVKAGSATEKIDLLRRLNDKSHICGAKSPGDTTSDHWEDWPVTCTKPPKHKGDHEGGCMGGTVTWPQKRKRKPKVKRSGEPVENGRRLRDLARHGLPANDAEPRTIARWLVTVDVGSFPYKQFTAYASDKDGARAIVHQYLSNCGLYNGAYMTSVRRVGHWDQAGNRIVDEEAA